MAKSSKKVYGVGVNDSPTPISKSERVAGKSKRVWICPFYTVWAGMLERGYSEILKRRNPTYKCVFVCKEWHTFSTFKAWMEQQDWEGNQLDKDMIVPGNQEYGPDYCLFVSQLVNKFVLGSESSRGAYPIGVTWLTARSKYHARVNNLGTGSTHLGLFDTPEEAYQAWLTEKRRLAKILAERQTDTRIAKAIINYYENYKQEEHHDL